jgi:4-amino-4-deoxy-L-arabinose transferase-like glycosyltransferase
MNNLIIGIIIIIFCALCWLISWRLYRRERYGAAVLALVVAGLALRFFTAGDLYLHEWDERYHALVAKNMISDPLVPKLYNDPVLPYDYREWSANHIWLHKQPAPLWAMAGSMAIFGVNEIALRLPSVLLTTIGIWLIFVTGSYFFDRKTGFLAAFFFSVNGLMIELAAGRMPTDHIDTHFLFFILLAVFFTVRFVQKQKTVFNILAGISIGLAVLSKWLPALIVWPVWLLLVIDSGKFSHRAIAWQFILLVLVTVAVFLPWQIYIYTFFPREAAWEAAFNWRHITEALEENTGPFYFFLNKIRINYGELVYLPLIWFVYSLWKKPGDLKSWALAIWFFIPLVFFSAIKTKMQGYLLFTAPVLFMITAAFFFRLNDWKKQIRHPWLVTVLLLAFLALPVRYAIERSKPFIRADRNPEWVRELREMGGGHGVEKIVLFNYPRPVEAMFYTGMTVYPHIPDSLTIKELQEREYEVMIYKPTLP